MDRSKKDVVSRLMSLAGTSGNRRSTQYGSYSTQQDSYSKPLSSYSNQQSSYTNQLSGYSNPQASYSKQQSSYSYPQTSYSNQQSSYSSQLPSYSSQLPSYSNQQTSYSTQQESYSKQYSNYPTQQESYSTQYADYPTQHESYSTQQTSYPTQESYSTQLSNYSAKQVQSQRPSDGSLSEYAQRSTEASYRGSENYNRGHGSLTAQYEKISRPSLSTDQGSARSDYTLGNKYQSETEDSYVTREQVNYGSQLNNASQPKLQKHLGDRPQSLPKNTNNRRARKFEERRRDEQYQEPEKRSGEEPRSLFANLTTFNRQADSEDRWAKERRSEFSSTYDHRTEFDSHSRGSQNAEYDGGSFNQHQSRYDRGPSEFQGSPKSLLPTPAGQADTSQKLLENVMKGGVLQGLEGLVVNTTLKLLETVLKTGVAEGVQANATPQVADGLGASGILQALGGSRVSRPSPSLVNMPPQPLMTPRRQVTLNLPPPMPPVGLPKGPSGIQADTARQLVENLHSAGILQGLEGPEGIASRQILESILMTGGLPQGLAPQGSAVGRQTGGFRPAFGNRPAAGYRPGGINRRGQGRPQPLLQNYTPSRPYPRKSPHAKGAAKNLKQLAGKQPVQFKSKQLEKQNTSKVPTASQPKKRPADSNNVSQVKKQKTDNTPAVVTEEKQETKPDYWTWRKICDLVLNKESTTQGEEYDLDMEQHEIKPVVRLPGTIKIADKAIRSEHGGIVTFRLPNGVELDGVYKDLRAVANGFTLRTMRSHSGNPSLTFPFKDGLKVSVIHVLPSVWKKFNVSYYVDIELSGSDTPGSPLQLEDLSGKDIPNLDGTEIVGEVTSHYQQTGVVSFKTSEDSPTRLTHFTLKDAFIGGEQIPKAMCGYLLYIGMPIKLKILTSNATKIPGIYYTAETVLDIPLTVPQTEEAQEEKEVIPSTVAEGEGAPKEKEVVPLTVAEGEGASKEKEVVPLTAAETQGASKEKDAKLFTGVIIKMVNNKPRVLFCLCDWKLKEKFYVICEDATVAGGPTAESHLHFSEGTRVLCSLMFKHDYGAVRACGAYLATADMPLRKATISSVKQTRGVYYPGMLATTVDGKDVSLVLPRTCFKINGKRPDSSFPSDVFQVGMVFEINHCSPGSEFPISLDISTNILKMRSALEQSKKSSVVVPADSSPKKSIRRKRNRAGALLNKTLNQTLNNNNSQPIKTDASNIKKLDYKLKGTVIAVKRNPRGMVLPMRAQTTVEGVNRNVHLEQVYVNGKPGFYLPSEFLKIGDQVRLQDIKVDTATQRYTAVVHMFVPKASIRNMESRVPNSNAVGFQNAKKT